MAQGVLEITDATFDTEVGGPTPTLVDFWAPWCGPCRAIAPIIEQLAADNAGKLKVGKVNVDDNQQVAARYGITSIPTLMLFHKGELKERVVGAQSKSALQNLINTVL